MNDPSEAVFSFTCSVNDQSLDDETAYMYGRVKVGDPDICTRDAAIIEAKAMLRDIADYMAGRPPPPGWNPAQISGPEWHQRVAEQIADAAMAAARAWRLAESEVR